MCLKIKFGKSNWKQNLLMLTFISFQLVWNKCVGCLTVVQKLLKIALESVKKFIIWSVLQKQLILCLLITLWTYLVIKIGLVCHLCRFLWHLAWRDHFVVKGGLFFLNKLRFLSNRNLVKSLSASFFGNTAHLILSLI